MYNNIVSIALLALLAACAPDSDLDGLDLGSDREALQGFEQPGTLPIDADLAAPPTGSVGFWLMGEEWREDVGSPLYRGAEADLSVAPERLPRCGAGGAVTAFLRPDVGSLVELPLRQDADGSPLHGRFRVPSTASELEVWIRADRGDGCVEYDSDYGRNYLLPVHEWAPVRVHFEAGWAEWAEGPLHAGAALAVVYDHARLPDCRVVYRGFPSWDIIAHAAFDGIEVPGRSVLLTTYGGPPPTERLAALALFPIPWDAEAVELWFENRQYPPTCQAWDSDFGRNYRFDVER